jgi:glycosyltransferase involved in cell wall biosynthesis
MNILLNASNLRFGGGRTVALNLINAAAPLMQDDALYIIAPTGVGFESLTKHTNITLLPLPASFNYSWLTKLRFNYRNFPKWCKRLKIDKVVSLGNVAFPFKGKPHLLYIQLPHLVYHESPAWKQMDARSFLKNSLMDQYVAFHMRNATSFAVQTEVMKQRLIARFKVPEDVHIVPNAPIDTDTSEVVPFEFPEENTPWKLLFLSKYYPHKGYEILCELGRIIRDNGIPLRISLTLSKDESAGAAGILKDIKEAGLTDIIQNIGNVRLDEVGKVVSAHDGVFLPSLMESFSGAYAEAIHYQRPLFTSHYDFATELLGDAAFYFDPLKAQNIADVLANAIKDRDIVREKLAHMKQLLETMPDWSTIGAEFAQLIYSFK